MLITNARIATMTGAQGAEGEKPLAIVEGGAVATDGDRIVYVGHSSGAPGAEQVIDAQGALLAPGLIDPHTHLIFAGDRAGEHAQRLAGASYLDIARTGGGIHSTVRATRAASDEQLIAGARERLQRLARSGVTSAEVKTGYGLSIQDELRLLRLLREAARGAGCEVIPTLLALHAAPTEIDRETWLHQVVEDLTPEAAREGARGCDAFLEQGAFSRDECRLALEAGARAGLVPHLHADQFSSSAGAQLAADLDCASADHLERITLDGILALARAGTVAVLLPLAAWFLREKPAQAAPLLEAGAVVALGSNINPGSQRIESVSLLLAAGCLLCGLTPAQALWACTAGAARALRLEDRGQIRQGLRADLVLFSTRDPAHLPYHAGVEHAQLVVQAGRVLHDFRGTAPRCG
ncbi:MAG: imidazolonepropionase [Deltaproteobacteria bacterium]|nr:MAG: imidazolonepropionase [Deltaproteobacteria bacterium]